MVPLTQFCRKYLRVERVDVRKAGRVDTSRSGKIPPALHVTYSFSARNSSFVECSLRPFLQFWPVENS